jgi:serine/threonine protein kinase
MKPKNVLIFNKPILHAKIADFSHSLLDTGEICNLVGGTWAYSAPEWNKSASTAELLKTDIYSYGLIFGNLILGSELVTNVEKHPPFDLHVSTQEGIQKLKQDDQMKEYLSRLVHITDQDSIDSDLDEFPLIYKIFENTVQLNPKTRNLDRVVGLLEGR